MKNLIILVFLLSVLTLKAQNNTKGEKLETIYFRNPQYVLSMDKVMYPGYNLKFENIVLHEYLNNKKVSTTPLKMPARKITFTDSDGSTSYLRKLKTYPSFEEYIATVATWTSAVDSNAVDFDQELYDNYRIAWNKTDWEEALYYVEEPKDFILEMTREGNDIYNDYFSSPAEISEFSFEYDARLDENFNIENESLHIYFMDNNDDINLTQLMPVKANNFADSLLNGYKKTSVRLKPILDRKHRQIGTDGDAGSVNVIERGYFNIDNNHIYQVGHQSDPKYSDASSNLYIDNAYYEDQTFPYKKRPTLFTIIDEYGSECTIIKNDLPFKTAMGEKFFLMMDGAGLGLSLQDFIDRSESNEMKFLESQELFEACWNITPEGQELITPSEIYWNSEGWSNLPLVEFISDSRRLNENEAFDADGNVYETTLIGDRRWMKENLRSEHFQDGSEIPNLTTSQWSTSTLEGIILDEDDYPEMNSDDQLEIGLNYNGYTIVSEKNVCPYGFWVPDADDIAELYNDVTPYSEYVKIKGNKVKAKRYSGIFYPVVLPIATALNVGWNSIALGADATLLAGAGALDLSYNVPWFIADLFLLGPILGWEKVKDKTYAKQMKYYEDIQLDSPSYNKPDIPVNEDGYILKYDYSDDLFLDKNGNSIRIQEEDYDNCEMYREVTDEFGFESFEPTDKPKYNPEWKNPNPNSGVLYNPLPTFKGNGGFHLFRGSFDLLDDVSGLFYYFRSRFEPGSSHPIFLNKKEPCYARLLFLAENEGLSNRFTL